MTVLVRDAMVPDPLRLEATASAQDAGAELADPNVRAILVCDETKLVGVVTRKTLVREVVAAGRDPCTTALGSIAEPPIFTLEGATPLEAAFRELEARDLERVPVTERGRLVGVLSRATVQRRLYEDSPPGDDRDGGG